MTYPEFTTQDLANFTGRPKASFREPYVTGSALPQALLLFKMGTCLASLNDLNADGKNLARYAILAMADAIQLASQYASVHANPFNSESIGSYSYSKVAKAVADGFPTGVFWFDSAIQSLSVCETTDGLAMSGGIEVFENASTNVIVPGHSGANLAFLTPGDIADSRSFGWDPSPGHYLAQGD